MTGIVNCKHCGSAEYYQIQLLYESYVKKLFIVYCGRCKRDIVPFVAHNFMSQVELYEACRNAWNAENKVPNDIVQGEKTALDIVGRLRDGAGKYIDEDEWRKEIELEAATEIEKLRKSLARCLNEAEESLSESHGCKPEEVMDYDGWADEARELLRG